MTITPDEIRKRYQAARYDSQVAVLGEIAAQLAELVSEVQQLNEKFADFFVCQGQEVGK